MPMGLLLLILLIVLLMGGLPTWGYGPSGGLGLLLVSDGALAAQEQRVFWCFLDDPAGVVPAGEDATLTFLKGY
jgi:hypothetical protein